MSRFARYARRAAAVLVIAALIAAALVAMDRRSVEYGNRLYRQGDAPRAAETYVAALDGDARAASTSYNLGTALLTLDLDSAGTVLRAAALRDPSVRQKSLYNLGYQLITSLGGLMTPDSTRQILVDAVAVGREALRLDPHDEAARWNLAVAQRRLDAMVPPTGDEERESNSGDSDDEVAMNNPDMARAEDSPAESGREPEDPRAADNPGQRSGPRQGAREAWATQDPGPMTREEALTLLSNLNDEPELLLRGILWSHRPDVAWWSGQAYPGGRW